MRRRRVLAVVAVAALALPACEDLDLALDLFAPSAFASDPDPAVQAAGVALDAADLAEDTRTEVADRVDDGVAETQDAVDIVGDLLIDPERVTFQRATYAFWLGFLADEQELMSSILRSSIPYLEEMPEAEASRVRLEVHTQAISDLLDAPNLHAFERWSLLLDRYCDLLERYYDGYRSTEDGMRFLGHMDARSCELDL